MNNLGLFLHKPHAMKISLNQVGKKFQQEWVFRRLNLELRRGDSLAILGKNGSGKTTLVKLLSGAVMQTEGEVSYSFRDRPLSADQLYRYLAYAAPYHEMIEEFTVDEMLDFYLKFKSLQKGWSAQDLLASVGLAHATGKKIRACSSGMKQKLRLSMAIYSETPLLLLDEPLTNLDREGITWYQQAMAGQPEDRIVVVCSNHIDDEFRFCHSVMTMGEDPGPSGS